MQALMQEHIPMPFASLYRHPALAVVQIAGKGRGVVAHDSITAGTILEIAPVVLLHEGDIEHITKTVLDDYRFMWTEQHDALPLGIVCFANHATATPTARIERDYGNLLIKLWCIKDLTTGEEVTHTYSCSPWFDVRE